MSSSGSILGPNLFLQYINDLPDDAICSIVFHADDTISTLNLNLTCKTVWTEAGSGLLISILTRLSLVHLTSVITLLLLMLKWICLLKKKLYFWICWGCLFPLTWIKPFTLSLLLKLLLRNSKLWLFLYSSILLRLILSLQSYHIAFYRMLLSCLLVLLAVIWIS